MRTAQDTNTAIDNNVDSIQNYAHGIGDAAELIGGLINRTVPNNATLKSLNYIEERMAALHNMITDIAERVDSDTYKP